MTYLQCLKGKEQIRLNELREKEILEAEDIPANKFKYVERGTQSRSGFSRTTETQTQGPERRLFSGTINRQAMLSFSCINYWI